jgi:gamma-glutamyltranspeptidase/glutathione hydrolase
MPIFAAPAIAAAKGGRGTFAGSGSGGYRIETGVLHTFLNVIDHGMGVQAAVDHPRVHSQGGPTSVDPRIGAAVIERMRDAGHEIVLEPEAPGRWPFGRVCAVAWDGRRKVLAGGAGPSWQTSVAGY